MSATGLATGARRPHPRRRWLGAALAVACAVVLAACGARVDTTLTIGPGAQGSRVMTLTLDGSDLQQSVTGGAPAIDASIQRHKPPAIEYGGITPTDDGGIVVTLTVPFTSADDYRQKVTALLAASGGTVTPDVTLTTDDSLFEKGAYVEENFSSTDLLGWLADGLVADGVVAESDRSNVFEDGTTSVDYGGTSTDVGSQISFDQMADHGVSAVTMTTTPTPDGGFTRAITYTMDSDAYATGPAAFTDYFTKATPDGGTLSPATSDGGTTSWTITFTAASADEVVSMTNQALGSSQTAFSLDTAPSPDSPVRVDHTLVDRAECSAICSPRATPIISSFVAPTAWSLVSGDLSVGATDAGSQTFEHTPDGTTAVLQEALPFDSVDVDTTVGPTRSVTETLTFTVANADVDRANGGFEQLLTPPDGVGTLTTTRGDDTTAYVVTIAAPNATELTTKLSQYLPGSWVAVDAGKGDGFFRARYQVRQQVVLDSSLTSTGVTNGYHCTVHVPFAQRLAGGPMGTALADSARTASFDDSTGTVAFDYQVSGTPRSALIFWPVFGGVVLLLAAAALVFRRRLPALWRAVRTVTGRLLALVRPLRQWWLARHPLAPAAPFAAVPTPHDGAVADAAADWEPVFTEADLV